MTLCSSCNSHHKYTMLFLQLALHKFCASYNSYFHKEKMPQKTCLICLRFHATDSRYLLQKEIRMVSKMMREMCQYIVVSTCKETWLLGRPTCHPRGMTWQHGGTNDTCKKSIFFYRVTKNIPFDFLFWQKIKHEEHAW